MRTRVPSPRVSSSASARQCGSRLGARRPPVRSRRARASRSASLFGSFLAVISRANATRASSPSTDEHGARVAGAQLAALELRLHRVGKRQQPERIGDRRPALADPLGDVLLGEPVDLDQLPVRLGFLQRASAPRAAGSRSAPARGAPAASPSRTTTGTSLEPRLLRGPQSPLARDQLVAVLGAPRPTSGCRRPCRRIDSASAARASGSKRRRG